MTQEPEYRALLAVDIEGSAGRGTVALLTIRELLSTALRESLENSGIAWRACRVQDLGDGFRVTAPPRVPKTRLIHPLVPDLAARLIAHNRLAGPLTRVRVRMALHAGDVCLGPVDEVAGRPLETLARMLDAAELRTALAQAPGTVPLALLLSRHFHEETVHPGQLGIDPDTFRKVGFTVKEHTADAWLHVPGGTALPPATSPDEAPHDDTDRRTADPDPASAPSKMVNKASGNGVIYATQHGNQHIRIVGQK
ncbi:hypothetical protein HUT18_30410 [Streptomyces sp. NA04227]|uniref:hypothetical protein n=1 Tax=Streptomyces sp. NA04227 TaxID=2742136 RepID=UPI00159217F3|nr:hypothetical protein [Streptomyces sp. NA04227]QKW10093.1 hypothetical protein HUT18_30410 [Streptomyces sp. NA04227]